MRSSTPGDRTSRLTVYGLFSALLLGLAGCASGHSARVKGADSGPPEGGSGYTCGAPAGATKPDLCALDALSGAYQVSSDRTLTLGMLDEDEHWLLFTDSKTGRVGMLSPRSATELVAGPTVLADSPVELSLSFVKDSNGAVTGVWVRDGDSAPVLAPRVSTGRREDVTLRRGDVTLRGTVWLPAGKGPFPAVVYAHGSGPATRHVGPYPHLFTQMGFAVLAFDKRGAGQSEGDYRTASFDTLSDDVLAGVKELRGRADIDPSRVGVWGISQGGWIGSLAASKSGDVKFLVSIVGSGVTVWENVVHEAESQMRDAGLNDSDVARGVLLAQKVFKMSADGASYDEVQAVIEPEREAPWTKHIFMTRAARESPWWQWFPKNGNVDPRAILPKVRCPVLWVLADRDSQVPTKESQKRILSAFAEGGNQDVTLRVMSPAGHQLFEAKTGLMSELPTRRRFVPGYMDLLSGWLASRRGQK